MQFNSNQSNSIQKMCGFLLVMGQRVARECWGVWGKEEDRCGCSLRGGELEWGVRSGSPRSGSCGSQEPTDSRVSSWGRRWSSFRACDSPKVIRAWRAGADLRFGFALCAVFLFGWQFPYSLCCQDTPRCATYLFRVEKLLKKNNSG